MQKQIFTFETGQFYTLADIPETHRDMFLSCSHSGACDGDVAEAGSSFAVDNAESLRQWLSEFGAWSISELQDNAANIRRMLWLLSSDIQESGEAYIGN